MLESGGKTNGNAVVKSISHYNISEEIFGAKIKKVAHPLENPSLDSSYLWDLECDKGESNWSPNPTWRVLLFEADV